MLGTQDILMLGARGCGLEQGGRALGAHVPVQEEREEGEEQGPRPILVTESSFSAGPSRKGSFEHKDFNTMRHIRET